MAKSTGPASERSRPSLVRGLVRIWTALLWLLKPFPLWNVGKWLFGFHLLDAAEDRVKDGVQISIGLFALIITQGITFVFSERAKDVRLDSIIMYALIAIAILGGLVGILTARTRDDGDFRHTYDATTIRYTRWVAAWSILFVATFVGAAAKNKLPDQSTKNELPISRVADYTFSDGLKGVEVRVRLSVNEYDDLLPEKLTLEAVFKNDFQKSWKIETLTGYIGDPKNIGDKKNQRIMGEYIEDGKKKPDSFPPTRSQSPDPDDPSEVIFLRKLKELETYTLAFRFSPRKGSQAKPDVAKKLLEMDRTFKVFVRKTAK